MPGEEIERTRVLSGDEIRRFWSELKSAPMTRSVQIALKLALLTGARIDEVAASRKSEFDLADRLWTIPGRRSLPRKKKPEGGTKNKLDHLLPLSGLAVGLLEEAFVLSNGLFQVREEPAVIQLAKRRRRGHGAGHEAL